jgi:DNA-binding transcriptional MocR family regulator
VTPITPKILDVLHELLWSFHNTKTGLCFPSYERIAEAAGVARSTVSAAIHALEAAGLISWVHRLRRAVKDGIVRAVRTSNGYQLHDPKPAQLAPLSSKSDRQTGTSFQASSPSLAPAAPTVFEPRAAWAALRDRLTSPS